MLGLINKSVQTFLRLHYGEQVWTQVIQRVGIGPDGFEAMLHYEDRLTALLEDIGAFLAMREPVRRLLRFGGVDYREFLGSLDELPGRCRLALPDLELPNMRLLAEAQWRFLLEIEGGMRDWGAVAAGLLRAMADDYGALVLIEEGATQEGVERVRVTLLDPAWSEGRRFNLASPVLGGTG